MKTIKIMNYILPVVLLVLVATPSRPRDEQFTFGLFPHGSRSPRYSHGRSRIDRNQRYRVWLLEPGRANVMKDFELGTMVNLDRLQPQPQLRFLRKPLQIRRLALSR